MVQTTDLRSLAGPEIGAVIAAGDQLDTHTRFHERVPSPAVRNPVDQRPVEPALFTYMCIGSVAGAAVSALFSQLTVTIATPMADRRHLEDC